MTDAAVVKTIDVTPQFNYSHDMEVVKRFIEQTTKHSDMVVEHPGDYEYDHLVNMADYVRINLDAIRAAVSGLMADDIQRQIVMGQFPLIKQLRLHEYEARITPGKNDICTAPGSAVFGSCGGDPKSPVHTL